MKRPALSPLTAPLALALALWASACAHDAESAATDDPVAPAVDGEGDSVADELVREKERAADKLEMRMDDLEQRAANMRGRLEQIEDAARAEMTEDLDEIDERVEDTQARMSVLRDAATNDELREARAAIVRALDEVEGRIEEAERRAEDTADEPPA